MSDQLEKDTREFLLEIAEFEAKDPADIAEEQRKFDELVEMTTAFVRKQITKAGMEPPSWEDGTLPEDAAIDEAFPTRSESHDTYAQAMRLVGARRSKQGLVALVNWLLFRIAKLEKGRPS